MALEDLTGPSKYIDALVIGNPISVDDRREGDDHIRGLKNVLRNSLPNVTGAITLTQAQLNALAGLDTLALLKAQNLADLPNKATSRTNLGVYSTTEVDTLDLKKASNLSDLASKPTSRINLGVNSASGWLTGPQLELVDGGAGQYLLAWLNSGLLKIEATGSTTGIGFGVGGALTMTLDSSFATLKGNPAQRDNTFKAPTTQWVNRNTVGGVGRLWTDVKASRAANTTYVAPDYPIMVSVSWTWPAGPGNCDINTFVGAGLVVAHFFSNAGALAGGTQSVIFLVESNNSYRWDNAGTLATINQWLECR